MLVDGEIRDMTEAIVETYRKAGPRRASSASAAAARRRTPCASRKAGLNVITLPKTIDNDVAMTDVTFGFDTALEIATEAIDRLHSTAHSHHRIIVVEVMGHRAGWLALGRRARRRRRRDPDPRDPVHASRASRRRSSAASGAGTNFSIVAVAEGARNVEDARALAAAEARAERAKDPARARGGARPRSRSSRRSTSATRCAWPTSSSS